MKMSDVYQEEDGSTFTHHGVEYDLNKVLRLTKHFPIIDVKVEDLTWILEHDAPDTERAKAADITKPILVAILEDDGAMVPLDGLHRLENARLRRVKTLPAKIVTSKILKQSEK